MNPWTALLLLVCAGTAAAQDLRITGQAGFGARAARGEIAPVTIEIDNRGPDREIDLALTWGLEGLQQSPQPSLGSLRGRRGPTVHLPVTLPSRGRKIVSASIVAPDADGITAWAFALDPGGKPLGEGELLVRLIPSSSKLIAIVGTDRPPGFDLPGVETTWIRPDFLPEDWKAYLGLEALIWLDGVPSDVRGPAAISALRTWVSSGGHLVVARSNTVGLENSPIGEMLPVTITGSGRLATVDALAAIPLRRTSLEGDLAVLLSTASQGRVRLSQGPTPLVVEGLRDAGRVTFVAFDPARTPILNWGGVRAFWGWLLDLPIDEKPADPDSGYTPPPRRIGSATLLGQAARFPDVPTPAVGGLFALMILYLLAVGPGDYFILRRLKRLELTWITFPSLVLVFTLLILFFGGGFMRRAGLQREITVVDRFPDHSRRRSLDGVLSPVEDSYRFADASPLCANFLGGNVSSDYSDELNDLSIVRSSVDRGAGWALNRGATGLLFSDRRRDEPSPLRWTWESRAELGFALDVRNDTGREIPEAILVTAKGVAPFFSIPKGMSTLKAFPQWATLAEFTANEGLIPKKRGPQYARPRRYGGRYSGYEEEDASEIPELQLNAEARRHLFALSFPPAKAEPLDEPLTGFARDLSALRWIQAGGTILLTWEGSSEPLIDVDPRPAKRTAFTFTRYFEGPKP